MRQRRNIWPILARLAVCVVLLGWVLHNIFLNEGMTAAQRAQLQWDHLSRWEQWRIGWRHGPAELWRNLSAIPLPSFLLSLLAMGSTILLGLLRWRMVLAVHGLRLSVGRAAEISFVAHFFNSFLLGSTGGDLMKAYYAARETRHKKTEAVVTVMADRLIGLWAMLCFAGLMMVPNWPLMFGEVHLRVLGYMVLGLLGGCTAVVALVFWGGLSRAWAGARPWLRRLPKGELLERLVDSFRHLGRHPWFLLRALALSMILNAACVLQVYVLCRGLELEVPLQVLLVIVPTIITVSAIPVTPSGLGVRENLFVFALAAPELGVDATAALSLSLLAYAGSLFWSIVGGVVYVLFREKHRLKEAELDWPNQEEARADAPVEPPPSTSR